MQMLPRDLSQEARQTLAESGKIKNKALYKKIKLRLSAGAGKRQTSTNYSRLVTSKQERQVSHFILRHKPKPNNWIKGI